MAEPTASVTLLIASWLTPSSLFIFVNLVIGTIAITSRFTSSHNNRIQEHELQHPFTRSPSLLQRVRSFRLTHQYTYDTTLSTAEPASSLSLNSFEHPRFWNESDHNQAQAQAQTNQPAAATFSSLALTGRATVTLLFTISPPARAQPPSSSPPIRTLASPQPPIITTAAGRHPEPPNLRGPPNAPPHLHCFDASPPRFHHRRTSPPPSPEPNLQPHRRRFSLALCETHHLREALSPSVISSLTASHQQPPLHRTNTTASFSFASLFAARTPPRTTDATPLPLLSCFEVEVEKQREQKLQIQIEMLEVEKQGFKWQKFRELVNLGLGQRVLIWGKMKLIST
ncbi:hypothetical protein S83_066136 [Arachis hypogaea]